MPFNWELGFGQKINWVLGFVLKINWEKDVLGCYSVGLEDVSKTSFFDVLF